MSLKKRMADVELEETEDDTPVNWSDTTGDPADDEPLEEDEER